MDESHQEIVGGARASYATSLTRAALLLGLLAGCSGGQSTPDAVDGDSGGADNGGTANDTSYPADLPYARRVESFEPGTGAGYNQQKLPSIVLGPPGGIVKGRGSLDVVSLGLGG